MFLIQHPKKSKPKGFRISWGIEHLQISDNNISLLQIKTLP